MINAFKFIAQKLTLFDFYSVGSVISFFHSDEKFYGSTEFKNISSLKYEFYELSNGV